jgi:hypothetical protein
MNRSRLVGRLAVLVALGALLLTPPGALELAGASAAHAAAPSPHGPVSAAPAPHAPRPATITCTRFYPVYGPIGNGTPYLFPITPSMYSQTPCTIAHDEAHVTFSSSQPGSGERFRVPVYVPVQGNPGQGTTMYDFYVGLVVSGDPNSVDNQSYAAVVFTESGTTSITWEATLSVLANENASKISNPNCGAGLNYTWQDQYWCENEMVGGGSGVTLLPRIPGGTFLNLTFVGAKGSGQGLGVYLNASLPNGSANASQSANFTLSRANTGSYTFDPTYASSCPDSCSLNWSFPFGEGAGFVLCPIGTSAFASCDSYNQSSFTGDPPIEIGSPEYYTGGRYSGDFATVAFDSFSGVCNGQMDTAGCPNFNVGGGTGYYPYFTYVGNALAFGSPIASSTEDFGGSTQYLSTGFQQDFTPFFLDRLENDSRAGFVAPGVPVNVSVRLQDLGNVSSATLTYTLPGAGPVREPMNLTSGNVHAGIYNATIPGTGANGLISFNASATNGAGVTLSSNVATVQRGPLPTFSLDVATVPSGCGYLDINGSTVLGGGSLALLPGDYAVVAHPCYPYNATPTSLQGTPGVLVLGSGTDLRVSANGSVTATWLYVRPNDAIRIATNPSSCGTVTVNGVSYTNGGTASLPDWGNYSLANGPCAMHSFAGYTVSNETNVSVLDGQVTPRGNGTLTAQFVLSVNAVSVIFHADPDTTGTGALCGGIRFQGAGYTDGESVNVLPGSYAIAPWECPHYGFRNWSTTGGASIAGGTLNVTTGGSVRAYSYHLTELSLESYPAGCGGVTFDGTTYADGTVLVLANNSTHVAYPVACAGHYFTGWFTTYGVAASGNVIMVNWSGTLEAVYQKGVPSLFVGFLTNPPTCGWIEFEGQTYVNSNFTHVSPGTVASISATACAGYGFVLWQTTGGIAVVGNTAFLNSSGSIEAVFHPLAPLTVETNPLTCGAVLVAGGRYTGETTVELAQQASYPIVAEPCAGMGLASWTNSSGAVVEGTTLYLAGPAILIANFLALRYAVTVTVTPAACGSVRVNGGPVASGEVLELAAGSYPLSATACAGSSLLQWTSEGNVSVQGSTLTVTGAGAVGAVFGAVPPSVALSLPASSYAGDSVVFAATVAVPVPPYRYSFSWTFGDGSPTVVTGANFTSHAYSQPGVYRVKVQVLDPLNRTANGTGTITIVAKSGLSTFGTVLPGVAVGAIALAAVAVALLVATRRRRGTPAYESPPAPAASPGETRESLDGPSAPPLEDAGEP